MAQSRSDPKASLETWSPTLKPGEQPDLMKIQQEASDMTRSNRYEESLERHVWYHNRFTANRPVCSLGVRNSFALSDWIELGRRYPKASGRHCWKFAMRTRRNFPKAMVISTCSSN